MQVLMQSFSGYIARYILIKQHATGDSTYGSGVQANGYIRAASSSQQADPSYQAMYIHVVHAHAQSACMLAGLDLAATTDMLIMTKVGVLMTSALSFRPFGLGG